MLRLHSLSSEDCLSFDDGTWDPASAVDVNRYFQTVTNPDVISYPMCQNQNGSGCAPNLAYAVLNPDFVTLTECQIPTNSCFKNDFALIFLPEDRPVTSITPVSLNTNQNIPPRGSDVEAMGWGAGSTNPNIPWTVDLPYLPNPECNDEVTQTVISTDYHLCAWDNTGLTSTCGGDSGECISSSLALDLASLSAFSQAHLDNN